MTIGSHDVYLWLADEWTGIKPNFDCVLIKLFWAPINQTVINEGAKKHTKNWNSMCQLGVSVMMTRRILNCWCWYCWIGCWCWLLDANGHRDKMTKWQQCLLLSAVDVIDLPSGFFVRDSDPFPLLSQTRSFCFSFIVCRWERSPPPPFFCKDFWGLPFDFFRHVPAGNSLLCVCVYVSKFFSLLFPYTGPVFYGLRVDTSLHLKLWPIGSRRAIFIDLM